MRQLHNAPTRGHTPWNLQRCVFCISLHYFWQTKHCLWVKMSEEIVLLCIFPDTSRCRLALRSKHTSMILSFNKAVLSLPLSRPIYCSWLKPAENTAYCTTMRNMWIVDSSDFLQHTDHFTYNTFWYNTIQNSPIQYNTIQYNKLHYNNPAKYNLFNFKFDVVVSNNLYDKQHPCLLAKHFPCATASHVDTYYMCGFMTI